MYKFLHFLQLCFHDLVKSGDFIILSVLILHSKVLVELLSKDKGIITFTLHGHDRAALVAMRSSTQLLSLE